MTAFSSLLVLAALTAADDAVLVQFTSPQCTHCQAMQPVLERLATAGCPVQAIDVQQQPDVARQFRVEGVPTYVVLVRGQETGRIVGATSFERLVQLYQGGGAPTDVDPTTPPQNVNQPPADQYSRAIPKATAAAVAAAPVDPVAAAAAVQVASDPQAAALAASVRLKVEDATGFGYGTGTIIDVHDNEALVVTCGHLFRESQGKGKISVDLFALGATQPVEGQLIAYNLDRDIALVSIRPGMPLAAAMVAPPGTVVRPQDAAFTVGCDKGAAATVRQSPITAVNKYRGKPNFTAAGAPIDGRSGGGLFTAEGLLIGVCNAADPADDEGLYAALASIHWQLDQIGQSEIYQRGTQLAAAVNADASLAGAPPAADPIAMAAAEPRLPALPMSMPQRAAAAAPVIKPVGFQPGTTAAQGIAPVAHHEPLAGAGDGEETEIVFIIRSKRNPQERSEVYVVEQADADLIARITTAARTNGQRRAGAVESAGTGRGASLQTAAREQLREPPVVRGQSSDF